MVLSQDERDALRWVSLSFGIPDDIDYEHEYAYYAGPLNLQSEQRCISIRRTDDPTFYVLVLFQDMMGSRERLLLRVYEREGTRRREIRDVLMRQSDVIVALDRLFEIHRAWEDAKRPVHHAKIQAVRN